MKFQFSESMKVATAWVLWGFLSLGVLGWGLWVVLDLAGSLKDAPAWVQAIGSIGAILAAVLIAQRTTIKQRQEKLIEGYEYMQKAFEIATYGNEVIAAAGRYILEGAPTELMLKYHISLLELALEDLKGVDHSRLVEPPVAAAFLSLRRNVNLTRSAIQLRLETTEGFDAKQVAAWGPHSLDEIKKMTGGMIRYLDMHPWLTDEVYARQQTRMS
ncbi:TPA: hypothetical protein SMR47_002829 [Pseudomonas putida]|nr:hypothetical protein [Pseudomonas putida]